jgi:acetyl-CoA carboxylase biotin carboxyl carrier protein
VSLSAKDVAEILAALEASSFDTLDLEMNGVKVSLRRGAAAPDAPAPATSRRVEPPPSAAVRASPAPAAVSPAGSQAVAAPLLGVFYRAPKPGEPAFVEVGSRVTEETIIGIIEVMKLMNTVRAGVRGEIVGIPARNGELVEFGEALMFVRPD